MPPCNDPVTTSKLLQVLCPNATPTADVIVCNDVSVSMGCSGACAALSGMDATLDYLASMDEAGTVHIRWAGVLFTDSLNCTIGLTDDASVFRAWLEDPEAHCCGDGGLDDPENPLDALLLAASQSDAAFVLLATDDVYHYAGDPFHGGALCPVTAATQATVTSALSAVQARVFIDPGSSQRALYGPLAVNGCVEDYLGTYSFARLRAEFTEVYD